MTDLKIDPTTGDLDLSSGTVELVTGIDAIAQNLRIRLQMFKGEWHLDERQGMPYFQEILGQKYKPALLIPIFQEAILETAGVIAIKSFSLDFVDRRQVQLDFTVQVDTGELLVFNEFIVGAP